MPIEYRPPALERIPISYVEKREADVTCTTCGALGGGTLSVKEAKEEARKHQDENNDHIIIISEVSCFM